MTPPFDADGIRASTFVHHVEIHDTLGSTNDRAAELARNTTIVLPALVIARHQTAGRGRGKNVWWSTDGALTFSLLLDPATMGIRTFNWPQLSLTTAVAVCDAIAREINPQPTNRNPQCSSPLTIKWPNDIMLSGRKVAGILIESPGGAAPAKDRLIVGIGINVNNSCRQMGSEPGVIGTAMCDVTGNSHSPDMVLVDLLCALERRVLQLAANDAELSLTWRRLCQLSNRIVRADLPGRSIEGICEGIADDGAMLIATSATLERIYSGSIRIVS